MNTLILAMILGTSFGAILTYIGATNNKELLKMLRFDDLRLMKTILLGIGIAGVLLHLSIIFNILQTSNLSVKTMNLGVVFGAIIFGLGFGFGGTCPGTCVAGSSNLYAIFAIFGGLTGAILFSYIYPILSDLGLYNDVLGGKITLFTLSDEYNSLLKFNGIIFSAIMIMVAIFLPNRKYKQNDQ